MVISTVFLDAGGIIVDETGFENLHAQIAGELIGTAVAGYSLSDYWNDVDEAVRAFTPQVYRYIYWKRLRPDILSYRDLYDEHKKSYGNLRGELVLTEGFETEIRKISNRFKIGIAGQYGVEMIDLLERNQLLDCFTYQLTQDDFNITKPDPRYYEQILAACGVDPSESVMVGDRIDKDIIPARQVGMKTVLIRRGIHRAQQPRTPEEIPDAESNSPTDLYDLLLKLCDQTINRTSSDHGYL